MVIRSMRTVSRHVGFWPLETGVVAKSVVIGGTVRMRGFVTSTVMTRSATRTTILGLFPIQREYEMSFLIHLLSWKGLLSE